MSLILTPTLLLILTVLLLLILVLILILALRPTLTMSNSGNNSGSPQGGPPTNAALQYFQQWSEKTPFLTRNTTVALVALYLATFFIPADRYLGNVTYFTLYHFEVYRVVLSPLVGNSFLTVLLLLFTFPSKLLPCFLSF